MNILKKASIWMAGAFAAAILPLPCHAEEAFSYSMLDDGTIAVKCADISIENAEIPSEIDGYTVTELAEGCFLDCTKLTSVTIPETVTSIRSFVFQNCAVIEEIDIPAGVTMIDDFVFEGCPKLKEITVDAENEHYFSDDGILFMNGTTTTLMRYPAAKKGIRYVVPENCGTISPWSFTDCQNLEILKLSNVGAIGADAFMGCSELESVSIPEGVTELIGGAFANCRSMRKAELPEGLTSIGKRCFYGCIELGSINFPESLETIEDMAFFGCVNLTEMTIPSSVKTIGENAIGYSVNDSGDPVLIPELELEVTFGSKAASYAKANGIANHSEAPSGLIIMMIVFVLMGVMVFIGYMREKDKQLKEKLAEEERRQKRQRTEQKSKKRK